MITIQVDDKMIIALLTAMPAILRKTYELAEQTKSAVQQNLTNRILNIRAGKLVRSIFQQVTDTPNTVTGRWACPMRRYSNSAARRRRTSSKR
jgi:hypothetical protein